MIEREPNALMKQTVPYTEYFAETMWRLREDGLLLVSEGLESAPNVMTIGWCALGVMWARPVMTIMVRPSRYTYKLLEEVPEFTVNVPPPELSTALELCGSVTGASHDKFKEAKLKPADSWEVKPPIIEECLVHYECRVIHRCDMAPVTLEESVRMQFYPRDDFHRYYFGEIVACYADADAVTRLEPSVS